MESALPFPQKMLPPVSQLDVWLWLTTLFPLPVTFHLKCAGRVSKKKMYFSYVPGYIEGTSFGKGRSEARYLSLFQYVFLVPPGFSLSQMQLCSIDTLKCQKMSMWAQSGSTLQHILPAKVAASEPTSNVSVYGILFTEKTVFAPKSQIYIHHIYF